jgi:hypothetical protein
MFKKTLAGLALGLTLTGAMAQDINFGIISTESSQNLKTDWQPLLDDMAKQTGFKVTAFFAPDYAGVIEAMRFNKVHVAWYGNKSAIEAVDRASGEVFAQMVNADGTEGYYSHLIVHKDSPIKSLDDVLKNGKSYSFGNGDPNSTPPSTRGWPKSASPPAPQGMLIAPRYPLGARCVVSVRPPSGSVRSVRRKPDVRWPSDTDAERTRRPAHLTVSIPKSL